MSEIKQGVEHGGKQGGKYGGIPPDILLNDEDELTSIVNGSGYGDCYYGYEDFVDLADPYVTEHSGEDILNEFWSSVGLEDTNKIRESDPMVAVGDVFIGTDILEKHGVPTDFDEIPSDYIDIDDEVYYDDTSHANMVNIGGVLIDNDVLRRVGYLELDEDEDDFSIGDIVDTKEVLNGFLDGVSYHITKGIRNPRRLVANHNMTGIIHSVASEWSRTYVGVVYNVIPNKTKEYDENDIRALIERGYDDKSNWGYHPERMGESEILSEGEYYELNDSVVEAEGLLLDSSEFEFGGGDMEYNDLDLSDGSDFDEDYLLDLSDESDFDIISDDFVKEPAKKPNLFKRLLSFSFLPEHTESIININIIWVLLFLVVFGTGTVFAGMKLAHFSKKAEIKYSNVGLEEGIEYMVDDIAIKPGVVNVKFTNSVTDEKTKFTYKYKSNEDEIYRMFKNYIRLGDTVLYKESIGFMRVVNDE